MRTESNVVQGLWIGEHLSTMERMSINSFLMNGHEYHMYVYSDVEGVPEGTILKDAAEIVPEDRIFTYADGSYAGFADIFRYKLLLEKGGYWVDSDLICIQQFRWETEYLFGQERTDEGSHVNCGVIKAPPNSPIMRHCCDLSSSKDPDRIVWEEIGPSLLNNAVKSFELTRYIVPCDTFYAIDFRNWRDIIDGDRYISFEGNVYAVHLWNELWRRNHVDKDAVYHPKSLYESFKRKYLPPVKLHEDTPLGRKTRPVL